MKSTSPRFEFKCAPFGLVAALVFLGCNGSDRGKWELIHSEGSPHAASVGPILFDSEEKGWTLTWAQLSRVRDQGRTWTPVLTNQNGQRAFYSFTFKNSMSGVVVGTQRKGDAYTVLILHTSDGGVNWEESATDVKAESDRDKRPALFSVSFCGEKSGWAVGENLILHTVDGGLTWQTQRIEVNGERLSTVGCNSSERAWAAGTGGLVLKTSDGGNTWTRQEVGTKDILMQIRFFGENGWMVGGTDGKPLLLRTRDRGDTWDTQQLNITAGLFDIFFIGNRGWIVGEKGTILASDDGGQTWLSQDSPTRENLTCLFFLSTNQGWAGGDRLTLLRFSDRSVSK